MKFRFIQWFCRCYFRYVCTGGATHPQPIDYVEGYPCPQGYYCPAGATVPLGCDIGTYNDKLAQANCTVCYAGSMCHETNMTTPVDCKEGKKNSLFMPLLFWMSNIFNFTTAFLRASENLRKVSMWRSEQLARTWCCSCMLHWKPFLLGYYCPAGVAPQPCPEGTFNNHTGLKVSTECTYCSVGHFCQGVGNSQPSGEQ